MANFRRTKIILRKWCALNSTVYTIRFKSLLRIECCMTWAQRRWLIQNHMPVNQKDENALKWERMKNQNNVNYRKMGRKCLSICYVNIVALQKQFNFSLCAIAFIYFDRRWLWKRAIARLPFCVDSSFVIRKSWLNVFNDLCRKWFPKSLCHVCRMFPKTEELFRIQAVEQLSGCAPHRFNGHFWVEKTLMSHCTRKNPIQRHQIYINRNELFSIFGRMFFPFFIHLVWWGGGCVTLLFSFSMHSSHNESVMDGNFRQRWRPTSWKEKLNRLQKHPAKWTKNDRTMRLRAVTMALAATCSHDCLQVRVWVWVNVCTACFAAINQTFVFNKNR